MSSVLTEGYWFYAYPGDHAGWAKLEPEKIGPEMVKLGIAGVVPQYLFEAPAWLAANDRVAKFRGYGLGVGSGIGSQGPGLWQGFADALIAGLKLLGVQASIADYESTWDGHATEANNVANRIYAAEPENAYRVLAFDWGHPEQHPDWPVVGFNRRIIRQICAECYAGKTLGASLSRYAWARQWYNKRGDWTIIPTLEAYRHTVEDYETFAGELTILFWEYRNADASCKTWLACRAALRNLGLVGASAVGDFQRWKGLDIDWTLGPETAAALGVRPYPGTVWTGNFP